MYTIDGTRARAVGRARRGTAVALTTALMLAGIGCKATAWEGHRSERYVWAANWLCRPATDDRCDRGQDRTIVTAGGTLTTVPWSPAVLPKADCFYVYPTVSKDPGIFADDTPSPDEEGMIIEQQAARFSSLCRMFVPFYRQLTLAAVRGGVVRPEHEATVYAEVLDAFKHFVANDNGGRPFLLIGHSQGAQVLSRLVREHIDPQPALRAKLVSAYLLGATVSVATGSDRGGDFADVPLCRAAGQTGCVVTYASFRSDVGPSWLTPLGKDAGHGRETVCTNPAALAGGRAWLRPIFDTEGMPMGWPVRGPWVPPAKGTVTTPFVDAPRYVEGECVARNGYHYLEVTVHSDDPGDVRADDMGGDYDIPPFLGRDLFGLHLIDTHLAMGDLMDLAATQITAHRS